MFGEKMKKTISIVLIFGMILSGNGFTTFASSVDDYVTKAEENDNKKDDQSFYYQMSYEEQHYQYTSLKTKNNGTGDSSLSGNTEEGNVSVTENDSENNEKNGSEDENNLNGQGEAQNQITNGEPGSNEPGNTFDDYDDNPDNENKSSDEEEPEEDETTTTAHEDEEETTTVDQTTDSFDEESSNENQTTNESIDETTTVVPAEGETTTTVAPITEESTTIVEEESSVESTTETSVESTTETSVDTTTTTAVETTTTEVVEEETASDSEAKKITEEEEETSATTSEAEKVSDAEEATTSEVEKIEVVEATQSEIVDLKSTKSEITFVKEVATTSVATKSDAIASTSVITVTKYILATRSLIATTSIWKVKKFLINDELTGSFLGQVPSEEEMNEKYLPKTVRVLIEDQLGNQRVVAINAKWDRIRVNQQSGARVKSVPTATRAYVPKNLEGRGLKIDVNKGVFAKDTVNVAKEDAERLYEQQVQKGISDFYAESYAKEHENDEETVEEVEEIIEDEVADSNDGAEENTEEETYDEEATTEETTEAEPTEAEPTEATVVEKEEITEPTVAGFSLTEADSEPEDDSQVTYDEDGNALFGNSNEETNTSADETTANNDTTATSSIVENANGLAVVDPYVIKTVYETSEVEKVSGADLVEDPGLLGNVATQVVNPNTANFAVGGELNMDAVLESLAESLGDNAVVFMPSQEPVQLTTFGNGLLNDRVNNNAGGGLFGAGGPADHVHANNRVLTGTWATRYTTYFDPTYSGGYAIDAESDLRDYVTSGAGRLAFLAADEVKINNVVDFKNKDLFLCLNGKTLKFTWEEDTKNNTVKGGILKNVKNLVVTDCSNSSGDPTGQVSGLNTTPTDSKYHVPYDRKASVSVVSETGSVNVKNISMSAIETKGTYVAIVRANVRDLWSNVHDKIQFSGYDDDAAAFVNATASYVAIGGVTAERLVGAQGGLLKAENVEYLDVFKNTFTDNKAFKGACFNVKFKDDTDANVQSGTGTNRGVIIRENEFKQNAYAFFDSNDENPYTFGRYPFAKTYYYKVDGTGILEEKITSGFNETGDGTTNGYTRANDSKPKGSATYQYQNLGYEKATYNYDATMPNGLVLVTNIGIGASNGYNGVWFENNTVKDNMPYDLCGTVHLSLSNSLADSVSGSANKDNVSINVKENDIQNNCQYKSSKNDGDTAAGITVSVDPGSYAKHLIKSYEEAYKMGTNSEAIPYLKAVYKNGEFGVAGKLDFFNNNINNNYNNSPNPGAVSIRNIGEVHINNTTDPGIGQGTTPGAERTLTKGDDTKKVTGNFTAGGGAAYEFFRNGNTKVFNSIFENNNAVTKGGAVYISGERNIEFINEDTTPNKSEPTVIFRNNYARTFGGAVYASDSDIIKFTKVDFKDNYLLSGARWVTTMGLADYYTNWYYGYQQGSIRKDLPKELKDAGKTRFDKIIDSSFDLPFVSSAYANQFYYVKDEDATYVATLSNSTYVWKQLDDAWTYYGETRKSAARGFVEPYLFGDNNKKLYVERGSTQSLDDMWAGEAPLDPDGNVLNKQTIGTYDTEAGAIGGRVVNMGKGGAFALASMKDTEVIFESCDIKDNISSFTGGAIYANTEKGMIRIYGTEASRSEVSGNLAGRSGGFMMIENTRASLSYVNVMKNHAEQGGAVFTFTDPDKGYAEEDSEFYIYKTDIVENGFLTAEDKTPYEDYTEPKENYSFEYFGSGNTETLANKGAIIEPEGHNYTDINNEARHALHMSADKSDWTEIMKTGNADAGDSSTPFYAGGAIYTYASQVKFDTGAYVAKNTNTLYSIAGSTILTRQTTNHDLNDKEDEITFEENKGQYVFGHFSTFKARFQFYGGKIVNNELEEKASSDAKYDYIDTVERMMGGKTYGIYTAYALSDFKKAEERSIVLGGNIMIKDNKQGSKIYNLGLEEGAEDRNYRFELSQEYTLHKNAEIYLTPREPNNLRYQLFGTSMTTYEEELAERARREANGEPWPNYGLWRDDWVASISEGAVVQNVFKNDLADDPMDGRVIYTATNEANNDPGYTSDFGQIYLEDPNNLISMKFELYDLDKNGNHRYESQLETQYFSPGSRVQSPLSDSRETMKFSTDSSIRLIDLVGYQGDGNDKRFAVWDYKYQVTKGDIPPTLRIRDPEKHINIPGDNDVYNVQTLIAINAMMNHRHKICGTPIGEPCNHPDGSTHDDEQYYYGEDGVENLQTVSRKDYDQPDYVEGGHLSIEVSTLSQLMYARKHPEYMYVLTNDLIIEKEFFNRQIDGIINDADKPLKNLKLCLNGYNIYINDNRQLATFFGENCYICNCQDKEVEIRYNYNSATHHNYYPNTAGAGYVLNVNKPSTAAGNTNLNVYGRDKGHIVFEGLYFYNTNNSLVNLAMEDKFNMAYVDFKNIGARPGELGRPTLLASTLLDLPCDAYISTVSFTNVVQTLTTSNPKSDDHKAGQGIIRLLDYNEKDKTVINPVTQVLYNVTFDQMYVDKQYSSIIASNQRSDSSSLTIDGVSFTNSTITGRAAVSLSKADSYYRGSTIIRNSTFSNLNPVVNQNTQGYTGGAIYTAGNLGQLTIEDCLFENCGIKNDDINLGYTKALNGGAIYIGNTDTNTVAHDVNPISIKKNAFIENNGNYGGAIYLFNVPDAVLEDNVFMTNKANRGSAIYQENTADVYRQGSVEVIRPMFIDNGLVSTTSRGTYYVKLPKQVGKNATPLTFTDFYAKNNVGATSVFYADYLAEENIVLFKGKTEITDNVGGPVLSINNSSTDTNEGYIRFTEKTLIQKNVAGTTYAIYSGKGCAIHVQFAGIATVSENVNNAGREANIYASARIKTGVVPGEKFDGPNSLLFYSTDSDQPIMEWAPHTIEGFETPGLFLEDHIKPDNDYPTSLFVIYKTNEPGSEYTVYIGKRTDAIVIKGYLTSTISTTEKMLAKRGALDVYMDNFATPTEALEQLRIDQPQYNNFEFGGWIIKNSQGEFETLVHGKTKINVDDEITLDAYWITKTHDHKSCGCPKGACEHGTPDDETWIGAFRESVLGIDSKGHYLILEDLNLTKAFTNPVKGYAICLNGHTLTRNYSTHLVNITETATNSGINLINCPTQTQGTIRVTGSIRTNLPMIKIAKNNTASSSLIMKNFNITNIRYQGDEGILVNAEDTDITWENVKIDKAEVLTRALISAKNSNTKIIAPASSLLNPDNNPYSFDLRDNHYLGGNGIFKFDGGKAEFKNVQIHSTVVTQGQGLVQAANVESLKVDNSSFRGNTNNSGNSAVFYLNNIKYASFSNIKFKNNETSSNGAVFYINNLQRNAEVNILDSEFTDNKAGIDGGAIFYEDSKVGNKLTLNLTDVEFSNNESLGTEYGGGAIAFYTRAGVVETVNNEINIKITDHTKDAATIKSNTSNGNGGFIYAKDTTINVVSTETTLTTADQAFGFTQNMAKNGNHGGVFYLDRSKLNIKPASGIVRANNNTTEGSGRGAFIYSLGEDNTSGVTNHKDVVYLKNVDIKRGGGASDEAINGLVAIGPYADFHLDGLATIGEDTTTPAHKGLYFFSNGIEDLKINVTKASRSLAAGFDYGTDAAPTSKIYATTEYADFYVIGHYTKHDSSPARLIGSVFFADKTYDDSYTVYRAGSIGDRTVHIGNSQGRVRFDIGSNAMIKYKQTGATPITREQMLTYTQTLPFDTGATLDAIFENEADPDNVTRPGYTFKGWVTTIWDNANSEYRLGNFDFTSMAYLPSPQYMLTVYAVWAVNDSTSSQDGFIDVETFEQLYWKGSDDDVFRINPDLAALRATRSEVEYLAPMKKGDDYTMMLDLNGKEFILEQDIETFNGIAENRFYFTNGTIRWNKSTPKNKPFATGEYLDLDDVTVSDFNMNTVFADMTGNAGVYPSGIQLTTATISNNTNIMFRVPADFIAISESLFEGNNARNGRTNYSLPDYPLIYLTKPVGAVTNSTIQDTIFRENTYIYSYIMTEYGEAEYEHQLNIGEVVFDVGKAGVVEDRFSRSPAVGADLNAIIKTVHTSTPATAVCKYLIEGTEFYTRSNDAVYNAIIDAYNTGLEIHSCELNNLKAVQYLIEQEAPTKEAPLEIWRTDIKNNDLSYNKNSVVIMRRKAQNIKDDFHEVTITGNSSVYAMASYELGTNNFSLPSYEFTGETIIKNNVHRGINGGKGSGDIYLPTFTSGTNVITFDGSTDYLKMTTTSEITFYRPTITDGELVVDSTWTPEVHDHVTERMFSIKDKDANSNYVVYRDGTSLRVAKTGSSSYKTVTFNLNNGTDVISNTDEVVQTQYIAEGTYVDEPIDPINASGYAFGGWYVQDTNTPNKYNRYDFTNTTSDDYKMYSATRSTLYAKWVGKNIKVTVYSNYGGHPKSDPTTTFAPTTPYKVYYEVPMGETMANKVSARQYTLTNPSDPSAGGTWSDWTATNFTRDGLEDAGWFDTNGWNNGSNDKDWGNKWSIAESQYLIDNDKSDPTIADGNVFVKWRGQLFNLVYNDNPGSGTTPVVRDMVNRATTSYYNDTVGSVYPLPVPTRDGYTFGGWWTEDGTAGWGTEVKNDTVFIWTADLTLYAKWTPNTYYVYYVTEPSDPATGTTRGRDGVKPYDIFTFDRDDDLVATNGFKLVGNDFKYWLSTDSVTGKISTFSNAQVGRFNLTTVSNATILFAARWTAQVREIKFNLNDEKVVNGVIIPKGTTKATMSVATMSATYGKEIGTLPIPTRKGYAFGGWYALADSADKDIDAQKLTSDMIFDETLNAKFNPVKSGSMQDITVYARWENNLYNLKTSSGVSDTDEYPATGEDYDYDTAFDYLTNWVGASKVKIKFESKTGKKYAREGYIYKGLYGDYNGKKIFIDNTSSTVTLSAEDPNYNLGLGDVASGSNIVLTASWSELTYNLVLKAGNDALEVEGRIPPLKKGATISEFKKLKYTDKFVLGSKATPYEIDGYEFIEFTTDRGLHFTFDDIICGATLSEIIRGNDDVTITLTGHWDKNSYQIYYQNARTPEEAAKVTGDLGVQKMTVGGAATALYNVNKKLAYTGHTFDYWYDEGYVPGAVGKKATFANAELVYDLRTVQGAVATLSAVWRPNRYNLTFNPNPPKNADGTEVTVTGSKADMTNLDYDKEYDIGTPGYIANGYKAVKFANKTTLAKSDPKYIITPSDATQINTVKELLSDDGKSMELYVIWEPQAYKVKLDLNDGNSSTKANPYISSISLTYNQTYKSQSAYTNIMRGAAGAPTRPGYKFAGWTATPYSPTEEGVEINKSDVFKPDDLTPEFVKTMYAYWQALPYTITVDANTVDGVSGHTKTIKGAKTSLLKKVRYDQPINDLTIPRELPMSYLGGYEMQFYATASEWQPGYLKIDGNTIFNFAQDNTTIYAQYKPIPFTVRFSTGSDADVEGTMPVQNFTYAEQQNLMEVVETNASTTFKKKGYTFKDWTYTNRETLNNPEGQKEVKKPYTYVNKATISRIRESSGSEAVLIANWTEHEYTIKFDPATNSIAAAGHHDYSGKVNPMKLKYSATANLPSGGYSIVGYDLVAWVDAADPTKEYALGQEISKLAGGEYGVDGENKEITLNAKWQPKLYDINFIRNDKSQNSGSTYATISVAGVDKGQTAVVTIKATYDSAFPDTMTYKTTYDALRDIIAVRDGYDFIGWSLEQNVPYTERTSKCITGADIFKSTSTLRVYAQWKPKQVTAKLYALTRDFATNPVWVGGAAVDDTNPITQELYYDMPYNKSDETGLETEALKKAQVQGFEFVRFFAPRSAAEPKPNWNTLAKDTDVDATKFIAIDKEPDGEVRLNTFDSLYKDGAGNLYINLYGFWQVGAVRLYFVSTYSNADGRTKYSSNREVTYGSKIGYLSDDVTVNPLPGYDASDNYNPQTAPQRAGYTFDKWISIPTDPNPASTSEVVVLKNATKYWHPVQSATAYATWKPKNIKITFDISVDKSGDPSNPISWDRAVGTRDGNQKLINYYTFETKVASTSVPLPKRTGYKFIGWKTADNSAKVYPADADWASMDIYNDSTLYAYWKGETYTVKFDLWGGYYGMGGSTPSMAENITSKDKDGNPSITYSAGSEYNIITTSIAYKTDFKTAFTSTYIPKLTRTGYTFVGWFANKGPKFWTEGWDSRGYHGYHNMSGDNNKILERITVFDTANLGLSSMENVTLYALWEPKEASIKYNYNYGADSSNKAFRGSTELGNSVTDKVVFGDKLGVARAANAIKSEGTLIPSVAVSGKIYSSNKDIADQQHAYPPSARTDNTTRREGYTFRGYNTEQDGSGDTITNDTVFNFVDPSGSLKKDVYAQFTPNDYTITFIPNIATNNALDKVNNKSYYDIENAVFKVNGSVVDLSTWTSTVSFATSNWKLPEPEAVPGYTFDGWYTMNGANGGLMNKPVSNWGTKIVNGTTLFNLKLDVIKNGYEWKINNGSGSENSAAEKTALTNVARDIKLFAKWTRNNYTINWNVNRYNGLSEDEANGSSVPSQATNRITETVYYGLPLNIKADGSARTERPATSRDGYTFKGWSIVNGLKDASIFDLAGGEAFKPDTTTYAAGSQVSMYAIWEAKLYTVKLNFNANDDRYRRQLLDTAYNNAADHNNDAETMVRTDNASAASGYVDDWTFKVPFDGLISASASVPAANAPTMHLYTNYDQSAATNIEGFTFAKFSYDTAGAGAKDYAATDRLTATFVKNNASGETINMYSQWTAKTYSLAVTNGTNTITYANVPYNVVLTLPGGTAYGPTAADETAMYTGTGLTFIGLGEHGTTDIHYNTKDDVVKITRLTDQAGTITLETRFSSTEYAIKYINENDSSTLDVDSNVFPVWYDINGNTNLGPSPAAVTVEPTRPGWEFKGWKYEWGAHYPATESEVRIPTVGTTGDKTIIAVWKAGEVEVIFHKNDGSGVTAMDAIGLDRKLDLDTYIWTHASDTSKVMLYWNTSPTGKGTTYKLNGQIVLPDDDYTTTRIDLYAIWGNNPSGGGSGSGSSSGGKAINTGGGNGGGGGGGGGGGRGAGAGAGAGGGFNPLTGGEGTIANDDKTIASLVNSSNSPAQGSWFYNQVSNAWSFALTGNFGNTTTVNKVAANGYFLVTSAVGSKAWYKFDAVGNMLTGWQVEQNAVYYMNNNPASRNYGAMMQGWNNIDGVDYFFDITGRLLVNGVTPDGYMVDANGARVGLASNVGGFANTLNYQTAQNNVSATPLVATTQFITYLQVMEAIKLQNLQQQVQ